MRLFVHTVFIVALLPSTLLAQQRKSIARPTLRLFSFEGTVLSANRVSCGIDNVGELCADASGSPVLGGGFWPRGTVDQYVFNSGLQIAGIIPTTAGGGKATFPWAGDTVGAFFLDERGDQAVGEAATPLVDSRAPGGAIRLAGVIVRDTTLFHRSLLGRLAASDQDAWVRYWDGNPRFTGGRSHPMGILVEQRAMVWNAPVDNRDIVYFAFTITNVTARDPAAYRETSLVPEARWAVAALGARFQDSSEAILGVNIPDAGYRIDSVYLDIDMDADVGQASINYSTPIYPFRTAVAYQSDFLEPSWTYPVELFAPPLAKAPGFVGIMLARTPADTSGPARGVAMFSVNGGTPLSHAAPTGVAQLWRYLSGSESPSLGDSPCLFQGQQRARHYCYLAQTPTDTRHYLSTGPVSLEPGESRTFVYAYVFAAATVVVEPFIGGDLKPGIPSLGDSIATDTTVVRTIERAAGWVTQSDANGNGVIDKEDAHQILQMIKDARRQAK